LTIDTVAVNSTALTSIRTNGYYDYYVDYTDGATTKIAVSFSAIITVTITASATNGTITAGGAIAYGTDKTFYFSPTNSTYELTELSIGGLVQSGSAFSDAKLSGSYTFSNVTANTSIAVTFTKKSLSADAESAKTGSADDNELNGKLDELIGNMESGTDPVEALGDYGTYLKSNLTNLYNSLKARGGSAALDAQYESALAAIDAATSFTDATNAYKTNQAGLNALTDGDSSLTDGAIIDGDTGGAPADRDSSLTGAALVAVIVLGIVGALGVVSLGFGIAFKLKKRKV
jgi:hypothetical protein